MNSSISSDRTINGPLSISLIFRNSTNFLTSRIYASMEFSERARSNFKYALKPVNDAFQSMRQSYKVTMPYVYNSCTLYIKFTPDMKHEAL